MWWSSLSVNSRSRGIGTVSSFTREVSDDKRKRYPQWAGVYARLCTAHRSAIS